MGDDYGRIQSLGQKTTACPIRGRLFSKTPSMIHPTQVFRIDLRRNYYLFCIRHPCRTHQCRVNKLRNTQSTPGNCSSATQVARRRATRGRNSSRIFNVAPFPGFGIAGLLTRRRFRVVVPAVRKFVLYCVVDGREI